jgi:trehalose 6-phosphate synthase
MRAMRKTVVENDVARWAEAYLTALATLPEHHDKQVRPARRG